MFSQAQLGENHAPPLHLQPSTLVHASFIGQAILPLEDLTHDGQPMGFDLSLTQGKRAGRAGAPPPSVAVELTYNPLTRES